MSQTFDSLGLRAEIVQAVKDLGYETPTPIQEHAIPALIDGRDVLGQAQTGTGKTAAFALPMLELLDLSQRHPQGLILAPTRELAIQVAEAVFQYGKKMGVRVAPIYGGASYTKQLRRLQEGAHIVVGTPGRVIDLIDRGALVLGGVRYMVLDEADEMLKMGFIDDVERILRETPSERQTALFSATMPDPIRRLAEKYMHDPVNVTIAQKQLTVPQVEQRYYLVDEDSKTAVVARLLETEDINSALIFTRTKLGAAKLAETLLLRGFPVEAIHGDLSQEVRETVMRRYRNGVVNVLVATDVAARGLDIDSVSHVINHDMPYDAEDYVHRIGRTGRAGREGVAITLVTPRERRWLRTIEHFTKREIVRAKLPTADDVRAKRDLAFITKVTETLDLPDLDHERKLVEQIMDAGYDVHEAAAAAIRMARLQERLRPIEDIPDPVMGEIASRNKRSDRSGDRYSRGHDRGDRSRFTDRRERPMGDRPMRSRSFDSSDEPRRPRRDPSEREAGMVRLLIDVGRDDGIGPGDVVGTIAGRAGIPGKAIGAIHIMKRETYVDVMEAHVDRVLKNMGSGAAVRGREVTVRRAD